MMADSMLNLHHLVQNNPIQTGGAGRYQGLSLPEKAVTNKVNTFTPNYDQILSKAYNALESRSLPIKQTESVKTTEQEDFSPQSVTDRIMGFIEDRLAKEKAKGASASDLENLYQQAVSGVEKGLREAKEIIENSGLLKGQVQENFNATANMLADRLEKLGQSYSQGTTANPKPGVQLTSNTVAESQQRSFQMEVMTQDGDRVTLIVNASQSRSSSSVDFSMGAVGLNAAMTQLNSQNEFSFQVEGNLDQAEIAALSDLFSQVNGVAETFYNGDVEQAFDQAMSVGMNTDELAAFRVDIQQTKTVVAQNTYTAIDSQSDRGRNPSSTNVLDRLTEFADRVKQAKTAIASTFQPIANANDMFNGLVSDLHSANNSQKSFSRYIESL